MIRHIVIWKLKDEHLGKKKDTLVAEMKDRLEALPLQVPGPLQFEVGTHQAAPSEAAGDIILVSSFKTWDALKAYDVHPEHAKVKAFVKDRAIERRVVDYEI